MTAPFAGTQTTIDTGTPRTLFHLDNLSEVEQFAFPTVNAYVSTANGERFPRGTQGA